VKALEKLGHEIVEIEVPGLSEIVDLYFKILLSDAGKSIFSMVEGEEMLPFYKDLEIIYGLGSISRKIISSLLSLFG
jgi:hypothetical protein